MMEAKSQIVIFRTRSADVTVDVRFADGTVWLTQQQIATVFDTARTNIVEHIKHIYDDEELEMEPTCRKCRQVQKEGARQVSRELPFYNLDMILSVGYRVNSKQATYFRRWANSVLKQHLIQGYTINASRLKQLNQVIDIISRSATPEIAEISSVLQQFTSGLELLDKYDHQNVAKPKGTVNDWRLTYEEARTVIGSMAYAGASDLFGRESKSSFQSVIGAIYQTFGGKELYPSTQEKAANLLYLTVKNHAFADGNKRIAAALFVYFLNKNDALFDKKRRLLIENNALAAITLMVALSRPEEKEIMCMLVMNMLDGTLGNDREL